MVLNQFISEKRAQIFEDLRQGRAPREGSYNQELLYKAKAKGEPKMGTVHYEPYKITLEYIYSNLDTAATIVPVSMTPPERIVYLPVPEWVIESIWQGQIEGSYCFESEAQALVSAFQNLLTKENNKKLFLEEQPKRRE